jgi:hypothetical protein
MGLLVRRRHCMVLVINQRRTVSSLIRRWWLSIVCVPLVIRLFIHWMIGNGLYSLHRHLAVIISTTQGIWECYMPQSIPMVWHIGGVLEIQQHDKIRIFVCSIWIIELPEARKQLTITSDELVMTLSDVESTQTTVRCVFKTRSMCSKHTQITNLAFDDFCKLWKYGVSITIQYIYWGLNDTHAIIKQEVFLHLYDLNN